MQKLFSPNMKRDIFLGFDKNGEKTYIKTIYYQLKFIDSARFIASSLSNFANNLAKAIRITKCKYMYDNKKCKTFRIKHKDCQRCLKYKNVKDYLIV